jgi:arylsulfatase A-like enzyme
MRNPRRLSGRLAALLIPVLCALPVFSAAPPPRSAGAASPPPKLVVIVSVDGLGWPRFAGYRPWFKAGLKRLLEESQVETACNYHHLNTETGPGHAALGTGAPPRVTGIVANRWFENPAGGGAPRRVGCTEQPNPARVPGQPPLYYREVEKDGRLYVFAQKRGFEVWQASGETGRSMARIGGGADGKTLVFDGDDAQYLYDLRHGAAPASVPPGGAPISGPGNLRVPTLADRLVEKSPASRVVALSGKDRGAIFLAGRDPRHVVYWYDQGSGRFTSSAAYDTDGVVGGAARDLVRQFNDSQAGGVLVGRFGTLWKRLPEPEEAAGWPHPAPNLARFQIPTWGLGFDHDLARDPQGYFAAFYNSPFQDQLLTDLALAFLGDSNLALGRRGAVDLLTLSYSAHDLASHDFGNESEEELDALRRLDRELGRLLAALDALAKSAPAGSVVLALSADHGFAPLPEVARLDGRARLGGRLLTSDRPFESPYPTVQERLNRELDDELCLPPDSRPIFGVEGWTVTYDRSVFPLRTIAGGAGNAGRGSDCGPADREVTAADLDRVFPRVVRRLFGEEVAEVLLISERARWPAGDPAVEFARNDLDPERSGDAFLIPRENVLSHWDAERGSGHGSQYEYDTHVPLLFWGGPFRPGEHAEPSAPYDLAPTLAALLGLPLPDAIGTSRLPGY